MKALIKGIKLGKRVRERPQGREHQRQIGKKNGSSAGEEQQRGRLEVAGGWRTLSPLSQGRAWTSQGPSSVQGRLEAT